MSLPYLLSAAFARSRAYTDPRIVVRPLRSRSFPACIAARINTVTPHTRAVRSGSLLRREASASTTLGARAPWATAAKASSRAVRR